MQWFDFGLPFGWEELSAVATAVAVIVALWANRKTTLQMRDTLRAQEQSKNLELFDKRVKIIHDVEEHQAVSDLEIQLLFTKQIVVAYEKLKKLKSEKDKYCDDLRTYKFLIEVACENAGEISPLPQIAQAKWIMEQLDFAKDRVEEYERLCKENEISSTYGSDNEEWRTYNYKTISDNIDMAQATIKECEEKLISEMRDFVQASIAPLIIKEGTV